MQLALRGPWSRTHTIWDSPRIRYVVHPGQPAIGYADLAGILRDQIRSGHLPPGARVPTDRWLQETYGIGRETVRAAITLLRHEGLVVRRHGKTSRVRRIYPKQPIDLDGVTRVDIRMPSPDERERMADPVELGVPVWELTYADGTVRLLPGDRWMLPGPASRHH